MKIKKKHHLESHIAEQFGVSIAEVQENRISKVAALHISERYEDCSLNPSQLEGLAYDSLFKSLCSEGKLKKIDNDSFLTPFCFVSVLAGTLLAIEIIKRLNEGANINYNYWKISPWHPPLIRLRRLRSIHALCKQCGNGILNKISKVLWE